MAAMEAQAFLRSATIDQMLHAEVDRIKAGKPLYKDQIDEIHYSLQFQQEALELKAKIPNNEQWLLVIKEHAEKYGKTMDNAIEDAAIWFIKEKTGLDHCRLIDDPDAVIPIPQDFQLK